MPCRPGLWACRVIRSVLRWFALSKLQQKRVLLLLQGNQSIQPFHQLVMCLHLVVRNPLYRRVGIQNVRHVW